MGKFKEIDLDIDDYVFYKKSTMCFIIVLSILNFTCTICNCAERINLKENIALVQQDRTELIKENKHLQEENRALKSVVENYK